MLTVASPNDTIHQQCSSLEKTIFSYVQLGIPELDNHHLAGCVMLQNSSFWFAWNLKIVDEFPIFLLVIPVRTV